MKLFEFEGKELFKSGGISVPEGVVVDQFTGKSVNQLISKKSLSAPLMVKAQVLSGKRGKRGLIKRVEDSKLIGESVNQMIGKEKDGEKVEKVLVEEAVEIERELFVSVTYSTKTRGPVLLFSSEGGIDVDGQKNVLELELGMDGKLITESRKALETQKLNKEVVGVIEMLVKLFLERDLFLAEINPLVITKSGKVVAVDAKVVTDDAADFRQKWELPDRNMLGRAKTTAEVEAEEIDRSDHRGVVGRVYLDLDGDIGVLAAGGGASLVAMDAMVSCGLKPANYTEFSGNPPREKIRRLTEIVLGKNDLRGAVLVGGKANFTDQFETLSGFVEGMKKVKPNYPIVVRRDGPRMEEAKEMLEEAKKKYGWDLWVYDSETSIIEAVSKLKELVSPKS